jgi:hypothetical protein
MSSPVFASARLAVATLACSAVHDLHGLGDARAAQCR